MQAYWNSLAQNFTFLVFLLPLMGAGLVIASSGLGIHVVRRTAMINAILTLLLTTLLVCHYDRRKAADPKERETIQMVSSLRWLGAGELPTTNAPSAHGEKERASANDRVIAGPDIRLAVGVDGVSLWLILLTAVLMIPAVFAGRDVDRKQPAVFYAQLLLLEASLIGLFASLDVVLFGICLEATSLFLFLLIGGWGGYERRRVVRKYLVCNLCGSLLILLGLIAIVVAHSLMTASPAAVSQPTFSIPRLVREIPLAAMHSAAAGHYWSGVSPWIFLACCSGLPSRRRWFPFTHGCPRQTTKLPRRSACCLSESR
jgi:NADH:ubiquinone oxidoreductase subunit 4 (subunit M)